MQNLPEGKLIVKHTFLEFVETPQDQRKRSFTEGALADCRLAEIRSLYGDSLEDNLGSENALMEENMRLARENAELRMMQQSMSQERAAMESRVTRTQIGVDMCQAKPSPNNIIAYAFMPSAPLVANGLQTRPVDAPTISLASCVFADEDFVGHRHTNDSSLAEVPPENYTTVMLRNLPNMYTREMFIDLLNSQGFAGKYTFVYLPIDFKSHAGLGYAFVDMTSPLEAIRLREHFEGFAEWIIASEKKCTVSWSHPDQQGFSAHVERYRNSPVMHKSVPEEWKPVLFSGGERVSFPRANRKIRAPRIRPC